MRIAAQLQSRIVAILAAIAAITHIGNACAAEPTLKAPNVVQISARIVTSGQPDAVALAGLAAQGFSAVI